MQMDIDALLMLRCVPVDQTFIKNSYQYNHYETCLLSSLKLLIFALNKYEQAIY